MPSTQHQRVRIRHCTPAGETSTLSPGQFAPVSRIIVIEDADYLGHAPIYLRRMMEESRSARFVFTTHTLPRISKHYVAERNTSACLLTRLRLNSAWKPSLRLKAPVPHQASSVMLLTSERKPPQSIFMLQLQGAGLVGDRSNVQLLMANRRDESTISLKRPCADAFTIEVKKQGEKNSRVLKGAGTLDQLMASHDLDGRGVAIASIIFLLR